MKVTATIELDRDIPDRAATILGTVPRITVRRTQQGRGGAVLEAGGERYDLDILLEPTNGDVLGRMILHMDQPDHLPLVVADHLTPRVRQAIETGGGDTSIGLAPCTSKFPTFSCTLSRIAVELTRPSSQKEEWVLSGFEPSKRC